MKRLLLSSLFALATVFIADNANATTWDLSTLNATVTGGRPPHFPTCPCTDPTLGTLIFNASNAQQNGWTMGTDTLYFMGNGRGNNGGKIYVPSGGPSFPLPAGQAVGTNNSLFTGDYALGNFPLYFWFGLPGSTFTTPAVGVPVLLNSFYIAGASGVTVTGYSDLGMTATNSFVIPNMSGVQHVTLNWTGIEQLSFSGGSFYVNDIEVNDALPTPGPIVGAGLPGIVAACFGLLALARRRKECC
jgi:hypothetical protein